MTNQRLFWIDPSSPADAFPDIEAAMREPDGLLAVGGDLSSERILAAYERGIFPWYVEGQPILWWSPDPRCVLKPERYHVSRRLARELRRSPLEVSLDKAFVQVVQACSESRPYQEGTWITDEMLEAYSRLFAEGWAHSVEVWEDDKLVGGIYGLAIDRIFFGESMFSRKPNGSKIAFLALCQALSERGFELVDCQVESPHLMRLGAESMPRQEFRKTLKRTCAERIPLKALSRGPFPATSLV